MLNLYENNLVYSGLFLETFLFWVCVGDRDRGKKSGSIIRENESTLSLFLRVWSEHVACLSSFINMLVILLWSVWS